MHLGVCLNSLQVTECSYTISPVFDESGVTEQAEHRQWLLHTGQQTICHYSFYFWKWRSPIVWWKIIKLKYICSGWQFCFGFSWNFHFSTILLSAECKKSDVKKNKLGWRSAKSGALLEKRKLKRGVWKERTEKKEKHSVLPTVKTSSDWYGADTEDNIHHKEQWSGP